MVADPAILPLVTQYIYAHDGQKKQGVFISEIGRRNRNDQVSALKPSRALTSGRPARAGQINAAAQTKLPRGPGGTPDGVLATKTIRAAYSMRRSRRNDQVSFRPWNVVGSKICRSARIAR